VLAYVEVVVDAQEDPARVHGGVEVLPGSSWLPGAVLGGGDVSDAQADHLLPAAGSPGTVAVDDAGGQTRDAEAEDSAAGS
jgi:hypothetical protein